MLLRDQLFLTPAFQGELLALLDELASQEVLCHLLYLLPNQVQPCAETGRILEVGENWLQMETYHLETPMGLPGAAEQLYTGVVYLPTHSVIRAEVGPSAYREYVQRLLDERRDWLAQQLPTEGRSQEVNPPVREENTPWGSRVGQFLINRVRLGVGFLFRQTPPASR